MGTLRGRFAPDCDTVAPEGRCLSRFAYLRRDGERLLLESAEVDARVAGYRRTGTRVRPASNTFSSAVAAPVRGQTSPVPTGARRHTSNGSVIFL